MVSTAEFPDQLRELTNLVSKVQLNEADLKAITRDLLERFYVKFNSPTMCLIRQRNRYDESFTWVNWPIPKEDLFLWAVDMWNLSKDPELPPILDLIKQQIIKRIKDHRSALDDLIPIAEYIEEGKIPHESLEGELFSLIGCEFLENLDPFEAQIDDFRAISTFLDKFPSRVTSDKRTQINENFKEFSEYEFDAISQQSDDADLMLQMLDDLEMVSDELGVDLSKQIQSMRDDANELLPPEYEGEDRMSYSGNRDYSYNESEIDSMFQSFENKINK